MSTLVLHQPCQSVRAVDPEIMAGLLAGVYTHCYCARCGSHERVETFRTPTGERLRGRVRDTHEAEAA